jgi:hypothetical protein
MTHSIKPPEPAVALLSLLAAEPDFPQIEGDLSEEFNTRVGPRVSSALVVGIGAKCFATSRS